MRAIVAGAGIGGLAATLALREIGIEVTVLERSSRADKVEDLRLHGAGINMWPNGAAALKRLGVIEHLPEQTVEMTRIVFRDWRGRTIHVDHVADFRQRYGVPMMPFHRADLVLGLLAAVGPESVTYSSRVIDYRQDAQCVIAICEDGSEHRGAFLIGADGIGSTVRQKVVGDGPPIFTGLTGYRGVLPEPPGGLDPGEGGNSWGYGSEFGWMPIIDGRVYWYAAEKSVLGEDWGPGEPREIQEHMLELFGGWHDPIPEMIKSSPLETILRNAMFYRRPVSRWDDGRVTLLGDAAHAMEPHLAQGGCQAIEDAIVLAQCLDRQRNDPVAGLREYERERIDRANRLVTMSNRMGSTIHMQNRVACAIRNRVIGRLFKRMGRKRYDQFVIGPAIPEPADDGA